MYPATPGNSQQFPLGWWGWADQGEYIRSARAMADFDFSSSKHFYPPLYPFLGAIFVHWLPNHPFWFVDLASLLWFSTVFILLSRRYVAGWIATLLFIFSILLNYTIFKDFFIPWTSTASAALLSTGIYGLLRLHNIADNHGNADQHPTAFASFVISLAIGLIAASRPVDALVGGILWLGYVWRASRISADHGTKINAPLVKFFLAALVGLLVGPVIFITFNYLVHGSILGAYVQVASSMGYFPANIPQKLYSFFVDGYTLYLEPASSLLQHYPWLAFSIVGLVYVFIRADWLLRTIAFAVLLQFILYLPYGDLLPNGLWRYSNVHYFKWTFPYLALFAWLFVDFLAREWKIDRKSFFVWLGLSLIVIFSLSTIRMKIDLKAIGLLPGHAIDSENQSHILLGGGNQRMDFIDITGLRGGFTQIYMGHHRMWVDGAELHLKQDFRVFPAPWGVRVLFSRPIRANSIDFQPDAQLLRSGSELHAEVGSFHFSFDTPRLFWDDENFVPAALYKFGDEVDFSTRGNSAMYAQNGWSEPEPWGRWTINNGGRLRLRLDSPKNKPISLHLRLGSFVNEKHPVQNVDIIANGTRISHITFSAAHGDDGPHELIIELPINLIDDSKELTLVLNTPESTSPSQLGIGNDNRMLGVGVSSLRLTQ
ncbi:hypothetical protein P3T23_004727 [Paraburkholderia sp. GAS448]|uniref:DUF7024 domain-containing protein n=1 Tax=Paraburkholderia sp. GAS448 TaxID=3035136 RepID=UPI003D23ECE4